MAPRAPVTAPCPCCGQHSKFCPRCGELLPVEQFDRNRRASDQAFRLLVQAVQAVYRRGWFASHPEQAREYKRRYEAKLREREQAAADG